MTAQSLKDRVAKRLEAAGQPKRRRADRYSKPFRSKPKPEGYVFGRPTLYRPEYCQRAIEFMGQGYSVTALAGHLGMSKDAIYDWINLYPDFRHPINMGRAARVAALETKVTRVCNSPKVENSGQIRMRARSLLRSRRSFPPGVLPHVGNGLALL